MNSPILQSSLVSVRKNNKSTKKLQQVTNVPEYKSPDPSEPFYLHKLELEYCLQLEFGDGHQRSSKTKKPWIECAPPNPKKPNALRKYSWGDLDEDSIDEFIDILWTRGIFDTLLCSSCLDKQNKDEFLILIKNHAVAYINKMHRDSFRNWRNRSGGAAQ